MHEVTQILHAIEQGEPDAAEKLLPLVYGELRRLAAELMARERPGQTLQATALVHEAYLRLVTAQKAQLWNSRGHFFTAAAEAMRRILIERARRGARKKHGVGWQRQDLASAGEISSPDLADDRLEALDVALNRLAEADPQSAELVKLRYFAGLTICQAAEALDISSRKAEYLWAFARAWLRREIESQ
jgi:RNA polymerase sigma factor (TIGR02999 family)